MLLHKICILCAIWHFHAVSYLAGYMRVTGLYWVPDRVTPCTDLSAVLPNIDVLAILGALGNAVAPAAHL